METTLFLAIIMLFFWGSFFLILFHYLLFPIVIFILSSFFNRPWKRSNLTPSVSFIVAAYNEEKVIEEKIRNFLDLDYPQEKLEFMVVSDGSTDGTAEIVSKAAQNVPFLKGLHRKERQGKTAALNRAVQEARHEILVFSDANSMFAPDAVKKLVRHFADPEIGGVCGRKSIIKEGGPRQAEKGDSFFWDIEAQLKWHQGQIHSVSTADGEIFALRRNLYSHVPSSIINDDMFLTFLILKQGFRVIYEPEAKTFERASLTLNDDFKVKARMICGGHQLLWGQRKLISSLGPFFSFQLFSHKYLRYTMIFFLFTLYFSNLLLKNEGHFYDLLFKAQSLFYVLAGLGFLLQLSISHLSSSAAQRQVPFLLYFPMYYCMVNLAGLKGFYYFLKGQKVTQIWKKAER